MNNALVIDQIKPKAFGIAPLAMPRSPSGPTATLLRVVLPGTFGTRGHVSAIAAQHHSGEITEEALGLFIGHLDGHLGSCLLHIELFAPRRQIEGLIQGINPAASRGTVEVWTLHLHRTHHGLDRSRNDGPSRQAPMTLGQRVTRRVSSPR